MLKKFTAVLALGLGLSACVNFQNVNEMPGSHKTMAFGYIDAAGAETALYRVRFAQVGADGKEQTLDVRVRGNAFYLENLPPGAYRVAHFVRRVRKMSYVVELPAAGPQAINFTIDKPGLYFLGSFKYTQYDRGNNKLEYELTPATSPTEKQILEIILPRTKGTTWETMIQKRMGELN